MPVPLTLLLPAVVVVSGTAGALVVVVWTEGVFCGSPGLLNGLPGPAD
jgi:hypothetical protein